MTVAEQHKNIWRRQKSSESANQKKSLEYFNGIDTQQDKDMYELEAYFADIDTRYHSDMYGC